MRTFLSLILLACCLQALAQQRLDVHPSGDQVMIGEDGIMRWRKDSSEITGFGVNYTVPFAYAYRNGQKLNVDLKAAIDQDVYHFARLGFDLFRVHVWDTQISDTLGNLLDNEHLELFDYLLTKLNERGIKSIITPIAFWGNGWPEQDTWSPGFAHKYGKDDCLTHPDAIKAQENYLTQFVSHVNRYRKVAYKDDPMVIAFEVCNEPHHRGTPEEVTAFVRSMKNAIRDSGCSKPVFYNVTHGVHLNEAYFQAGIDGGTFQWYPTGLGFQKEIGGNMLPNVDKYLIPFDDILKKHAAARFVYEFDAADMASTYMYPAMARSFRTAGMQLGTHFSYDPTFLAPFNTEYNTHFMNLAYAPRKALSLMIAGEVFRRIPMYTDYGPYPDNTSFGPFRISYEEDLAEMVTDETFLYTNHTSTKLQNPRRLKRIAGWGNSTLVEYEGTGAYFLDKLGEGTWRLELMPDATIADNLFGWNDLEHTRAVVSYQKHDFNIFLPEFADGYAVESIDWRDSIIYRETMGDDVSLSPGVYLITSPIYQNDDSIELESILNIGLEEFTAPPSNLLDWQKDHPGVELTDFRSQPLRSREVNIDNTIVLFEPVADSMWINRRWVPGARLEAGQDHHQYLYMRLNGLWRMDNVNPHAQPLGNYALRHYFGDLVRGDDLRKIKTLRVRANTPGNFSFPIEISLVMKDGSSFGVSVSLDSTQNEHQIRIENLRPVKAVLLPRPYPTFLPYFSFAGKSSTMDLSAVESLQISIGPGIPEEEWPKVYEIRLGQITGEW